MNTTCNHGRRVFALAGAVISACGTLHASIISSGNLVTVSSDRALRSYTFTGALMETLPISGLPISGISASPQGVAVIGNRLFIGLVSATALYAPKIVEVNPTTGAVISILDTIAPHLTALGDDGANLLLLDSVPTTPWQVYAYNTSGVLVNQHSVDRHFPLNFQGEGIDSDGPSIFVAGQIATYPGQPVITNTAAGAYVSDFGTNMLPLVSFLGGLAYDRSDDTLWVAGNSEFRQFSRAGVLLAAVNTGDGNTGVTGLEVIPLAVPEPTAVLVWSVLGGITFVIARQQRKATAPSLLPG
ncbi:MAG: hypothetical protein AB7G28_00885 [Pirellulales bacterium]